MKIKTLALATAAAVSLAGGAYAGTVGPGSYFIHDASPNGHGLWLNDLVEEGNETNHWSITSGEATIGTKENGDSTLQFNMDVTNTSDPDLSLTFESVVLHEVAAPDWGVDDIEGPVCSKQSKCSHLDDSHVDFFNTKDGYLGTAYGVGEISDYFIELYINDVDGMKPPQLGQGGSWFAYNADLDGFATWLTWDLYKIGGSETAKVSNECASASVLYTITDECGVYAELIDQGNGDINWLLGDSSTTTTIPLPAAGWLMIAGLGGLAAMRRRAKA